MSEEAITFEEMVFTTLYILKQAAEGKGIGRMSASQCGAMLKDCRRWAPWDWQVLAGQLPIHQNVREARIWWAERESTEEENQATGKGAESLGNNN